MAKLVMFMLCDSINNTPNPQGPGVFPSLVSPCVVLRPSFVPGSFSFGITAGVRDVDLEKPVVLSMQVISPTGEIVHDSGTANFPAMGPNDTLPKEYQGFMINLDIRNMPIQEEGVFEFVLTINGEELARQEIPIYRGCSDDSM